jgi:hypothetical protein
MGFIDWRICLNDCCSPCNDLRVCSIDLRRTCIDLHRTYIDLRRTRIDLHPISIDLRPTYNDLHRTYFDLRATFIELFRDRTEPKASPYFYSVFNKAFIPEDVADVSSGFALPLSPITIEDTFLRSSGRVRALDRDKTGRQHDSLLSSALRPRFDYMPRPRTWAPHSGWR